MTGSSPGSFIKDCTLKVTTKTSISTTDLQADKKICVMCEGIRTHYNYCS